MFQNCIYLLLLKTIRWKKSIFLSSITIKNLNMEIRRFDSIYNHCFNYMPIFLMIAIFIIGSLSTIQKICIDLRNFTEIFCKKGILQYQCYRLSVIFGFLHIQYLDNVRKAWNFNNGIAARKNKCKSRTYSTNFQTESSISRVMLKKKFLFLFRNFKCRNVIFWLCLYRNW